MTDADAKTAFDAAWPAMLEAGLQALWSSGRVDGRSEADTSLVIEIWDAMIDTQLPGMKVQVTLEDLKVLALRAKEAGTQNAFIDLVLEWAEAAAGEVEEARLRCQELENGIQELESDRCAEKELESDRCSGP